MPYFQRNKYLPCNENPVKENTFLYVRSDATMYKYDKIRNGRTNLEAVQNKPKNIFVRIEYTSQILNG